ncbi:hypothetical protein DL770_007059 [Monosporascus sp. CRB-9-2]|nr:hypothetical protein DL770_007059 [Monosporascus sp. CRB-9-2]
MRDDPKSATPHSAHLNENVGSDTKNTPLEEEAEDQPYRLFAPVSLTRDPRTPRDMLPERHAPREICSPTTVQGRGDEAEIRELTEQIRAKYDQSDERIVKKYRKSYFYNRPTWDIERNDHSDDNHLDEQERAERHGELIRYDHP